MSAEPVSEPTRRTDGDALARLTAIDHRLHQISTQLAAVGELLSQLDEIRTNLETLTESLQSAGTITTPPACPLSDGEDGSATKSHRRLLSLRPAASDAELAAAKRLLDAAKDRVGGAGMALNRSEGRSVEMVETSPAELSPLTPGEALATLFVDNANNGRHAANDALVEELLRRRRAIQALAHPSER